MLRSPHPLHLRSALILSLSCTSFNVLFPEIAWSDALRADRTAPEAISVTEIVIPPHLQPSNRPIPTPAIAPTEMPAIPPVQLSSPAETYRSEYRSDHQEDQQIQVTEIVIPANLVAQPPLPHDSSIEAETHNPLSAVHAPAAGQIEPEEPDAIASTEASPTPPANSFSARIGSGISAPTALQGPTRPRTVLPGSNRPAGANLTVRLQQQLGTDQRLGLEAIGGADLLGFDLSYTQLTGDQRGISVNLFNQRSETPVFDGGDRDIDLPNQEDPWLHRLGGGIEFFRPVAPDLSAAIGLSYQRVSVRDQAFTSEIAAEDELGNALSFSEDGQDDLLTLNLAAVWDTRDDRRYPTEGSRIRFGIDQSIPVGEANIFFNRLSANATQYLPLPLFGFAEGPRTLVLNVQAGTVIGDLPPYEAFSLGGSSSVRGYGSGEVGSGRSFVQATAEYRFPITSFGIARETIDLGGMLFLDYATDLGSGDTVTGEPAIVRDKPGSGFGYGLGLRARTPFGPARFELGWNDEGDSMIYFILGDRF